MKFIRCLAALLTLALPSAVFGQVVTLPQVNNAGGAKVAPVGALLIDASGVEKATKGNPLVIAGPDAAAATSVVLTGAVNDTSTHILGPFTPQLARSVYLELVGTGASGTAQMLRSRDGGATKLGLTAGGSGWGKYSFSAASGVIVNEDTDKPESAAFTYYLAVTLTAGSITYRIAQ